jgi:peptide/nickel transport system permease protein
MGQVILRRLLMLVPILLGVSMLTFGAMHLIPGDLAVALLGVDNAQDPVALENIRRKYGLDQPVPVQYIKWLGNVVQGDFGESIRLRVPVLDEILRRLPLTAELAVLSVFFGLIVGGLLGTLAAVKGGVWDFIGRTYILLGVAVPSFFLGTMLILYGSRYVDFIPTLQYVGFREDPKTHMLVMIYPVISLGTGLAAVIAENTWSAVSETMNLEHVRVARAKGLAERKVVFGHIVRNALIPITTITGLQMGFLLGGTIIIETIFAMPGLGRLAFSAINLRDYPLMQGIVLFIAAMVVLANLLADLAYALFDPRIRVN